MNSLLLRCGALIVCSITLICVAKSQEPDMTSVSVPKTRTVEQVDNYHGTSVNDPFRWLEDTEAKETAEWVADENKATFDYLEKIPQREPIRDRLTQVWNYERYGLPDKFGDQYFFTYNDGLQNQSVLYVAKAPDGSDKRVLLDPNTLAADGTVALTDWKVRHDGKYVAYSLASAGSDWNTWYIRDVATGKDLDDKVEWVKFSSASWTKDGSGFFYSRFDEPKEQEQYSGVNYFQKLYFHSLGTPQSQDQLIYERKDEKEWGFEGRVDDSGTLLVISVSRGTEDRNLVYVAPMPGGKVTEATKKAVPLVGKFEAAYLYLGNDVITKGDKQTQRLYFLTDKDAPRRQIISIDFELNSDAIAFQVIKTIIAESSATIESASLLKNQLFVNLLVDATSEIERFGLDGKSLGKLQLPGLGSVIGFETNRDHDETYYSFTNYITPPTIYRLKLQDQSTEVWKGTKVDFSVADYETKRVFYHSKDGTKIPIILSYKKGAEKKGPMPAILYAYGGFNISVVPRYSPANLVWMEMGGLYAVANLRGGGEYGRQWHEAGMFDKKQNVFDDFISAAEYLIKEKWTSKDKLAISGRSNGGLLVGATMVQRPDLFAAALPGVGVMDMLRFHKFTIGWAWTSEYGSSDNAEQFPALFAYSPYHNLKDGTAYPATLVTTADHDDRVVPGHSFKFAARLQQAQGGKAPVLIRIETSAGHGAGTSTTKLIDQTADTYAFLVKNLKM
jgi:prolyl oligopeptidase